MTTEVKIRAHEHTVVVYFDDGTTATVSPGATYDFQLEDAGFCTISETLDTVSEEDGEHPPDGLVFAEMMAEFWQALASEIKAS